MRAQPLLLLLLFWFGFSARAVEQVQFAPEPEWLQSVPVPAVDSRQEAINGQRYLLLDRQIYLDTSEGASYLHHAIQITSTEGLELGSQLSIDFDPAYETLTIHKVLVWRNGERLDRLDPQELRLFQQEPDLGRFLYSGRKTAYLILPDIRVGDILEYSYTISGINPVMGNKYSEKIQLDWDIPLTEHFIRILVAPSRALYYTVPGGQGKALSVSDKEGWREIRWQEHAVPAVHSESDLPSWYSPYRYLEVSEFASWGDVVAWALPLYDDAAKLEPAIADLARQLTAGLSDPGDKLVSVVHFVQQEIRYLGMEDGIGSHLPRRAADTLFRRYGDCKDKTVLLLALLKALGMDPRPALVSLEQGAQLPTALPSPYAFDHVIVTLQLQGRRYWLDGTSLNQGLTLESMGVPYYRYALLVQTGEGQLMDMDLEYQRPEIHLQQEFRVGDDETGLLIESRYQGARAEEQRGEWQSSTPSMRGRTFTEYYRKLFPQLEPDGLPLLRDDPHANRLRVQERYRLPQGMADMTRDGVAVYAYLLDEYMKEIEPERRQPLSLGAPMRLSQDFLFHFPSPWPVAPYQSSYDNELFRFSVQVEPLSPSQFRVRYRYENLTDHVPVRQLARYRQYVAQARQELGLTFSPPAVQPAP